MSQCTTNCLVQRVLIPYGLKATLQLDYTGSFERFMLSRDARLRTEREFRAVFSRASSRNRSFTSIRMAIHVRPRFAKSHNPAEQQEARFPIARFGFTVSKKISKRSHDRNRIKRRLREIARLDIIPKCAENVPFDCVVVARSGSLVADYHDLREEFLMLMVRAGMIVQKSQQIDPEKSDP